MIVAEELSYTYPGSEKPALDSVSFHVRRGEIFGFLGPNGAGKSTTQKILVGLLRDYGGRVSVFGRDLREWGKEYYERIGVSFEQPNHYLKLTALENLAFFRGLYQRETEEPQKLLELVGLADAADKRVSQFSKGMRTRLNLARALLHRPELLFLDEPTSGLDPVTSRRIRQVILGVRESGATVFLTTHDMEVAAELCDRVAFLVNGRIVLIDSPRALALRYGRRTVRVEYITSRGLHRREFPLKGLGDNPEFLEILRKEEVETIHTQETTLEEIFIEVTGSRLR